VRVLRLRLERVPVRALRLRLEPARARVLRLRLGPGQRLPEERGLVPARVSLRALVELLPARARAPAQARRRPGRGALNHC